MARRTYQPNQIVLERRIKAWNMRLEGKTYDEIAVALGMTKNGVASILYREAMRYGRMHTQHVEAVKAEQVAQLEHTASQAMQAWNRSKEDWKSARQEFVRQGNEVVQEGKGTAIKSDQYGDPRYLLVFIKAKEDIRKIIGADAPTKNQILGTVELSKLSDEELIARAKELIDAASQSKPAEGVALFPVEHDSGTGVTE